MGPSSVTIKALLIHSFQTMASKPRVITSVEVSSPNEYVTHWLQAVTNVSFVLCAHERKLFAGVTTFTVVSTRTLTFI